jgi:hypothetical protein
VTPTANRLVVRYGVLHATATLSTALEVGPSPRLTLTLASFVVAVALKAALRQPYVTISGRRVTVHLADVPALQSIRGVWPHVRRVDFSTRRGTVQADVLFAVDEDVHA